jgi:hypothetical protein
LAQALHDSSSTTAVKLLGRGSGLLIFKAALPQRVWEIFEAEDFSA